MLDNNDVAVLIIVFVLAVLTYMLVRIGNMFCEMDEEVNDDSK